MPVPLPRSSREYGLLAFRAIPFWNWSRNCQNEESSKVKLFGSATFPPSGFVIVTETVPAESRGVVAWICVELRTETDVAGVPPNETFAPCSKPTPVRIKEVPPAVGPVVTEMPLIVGFSTDTMPVPVRLNVSGLTLVLAAMLSVAARVPLADGVNLVAIVQLPPAATELPHVLVCTKSLG